MQKPPDPVHVPGTTRGERLALDKGIEAGRGDSKSYRTARDSTESVSSRSTSDTPRHAEHSACLIRADRSGIDFMNQDFQAVSLNGTSPGRQSAVAALRRFVRARAEPAAARAESERCELCSTKTWAGASTLARDGEAPGGLRVRSVCDCGFMMWLMGASN